MFFHLPLRLRALLHPLRVDLDWSRCPGLTGADYVSCVYAYDVRMANRTLYVSTRHEPIWQRAEALAAEKGISLSVYVTRAMDAYANMALGEAVINYQLAGPALMREMEEELCLPELRNRLERVERQIRELGQDE